MPVYIGDIVWQVWPVGKGHKTFYIRIFYSQKMYIINSIIDSQVVGVDAICVYP